MQKGIGMKKVCPCCNHKLPVMAVKTEFACPFCKSNLRSNQKVALLAPFILWALFVPSVSTHLANIVGINHWFLEFALDAVIGMIVFIVLYPLLLKIQRSDCSSD